MLRSLIQIIESPVRFYRRLIGRRRDRFYNRNPVVNTSSLPSTEKPPPTDLSSDLVYNIKNEPLNRLPISQIHSNDEKSKNLSKNIISLQNIL
jgi:hypothetical protein